MISGHLYHDDIQGTLGTVLSGATSWTLRAYRHTGIVMPHIARNDVFTIIFQMPHRKKRNSALDGVHIHFIPMAAANGNIIINYSWGWFNPTGDTVPDTLPNNGHTAIALTTADQYQLKLANLITGISSPEKEAYSSLLFCRFVRQTTGDTWGPGEIALAYLDAHFLADRYGSYNELTD